MIEIFGAVIGFTSSIIPNIFKYIQDKTNKKYEISILEMKMNAKKSENLMLLQKESTKSDIEENKVFYKTFYNKTKMLDNLNASVRPILAYAFFLLYIGVKILYIFNAEVFNFNEFWSSADNAIFLTIISFFYGQRAMQKILKNDK
jgi:hypothetical protein